MGGRYRTSKPWSARSGTRLTTPAKPPQERGNSSYQAPTRARSRSTHSSRGELTVTSVAMVGPARAAATAGSRAALRRSSGVRDRSARRARAAADGDRDPSGGVRGRGGQQLGPLGQLDADVDARLELGPDLVGPRGVTVGPRLDHDAVPAHAQRDDAALPLVARARDQLHHPVRLRPPLRPQQGAGGQGVVALLEDHGPHGHGLPHDRLRRVARLRGRRPDVVDHHASGHPTQPTR